MRELLNKELVDQFFESFEKNSEVQILETAAESKKLVEIARTRGIKNLKNDRDLSGFKAIYAFADTVNANGAILPEKPLLKALPTIIGKPVNIGHERRFVVGHILDYAYQQKQKRVIVYGVFYKSCFDKEWQQAKNDFKAKKLHVSFEIWSPADKRKVLPNGNYLMLEQEMAGMAILFRDTEPAFKGAKVLEFAKKRIESNKDLVFAEKEEKYEQADIHYFRDSVKENYRKMMEEQKMKETQRDIKCSNCQEEFKTTETVNIKCPKCFAVLDEVGKMVMPPQVINFKIACPSCKGNAWLLQADAGETADIKCQSCAKEYRITFAKEKSTSEIIDKINFLYTGYATCPQCHYSNPVMGTSKTKTVKIDCKRCGLKFLFDREKSKTHKQIAEIAEILEELKEEKKLDEKEEEKKVDIPKEIEDKVKEEQKKKEEKQETPSSEVKAEQPKIEEPKAETPKEEVKAEAPKEEAKPEKSEIEEPVVAQIETTTSADTASSTIEEATTTENTEAITGNLGADALMTATKQVEAELEESKAQWSHCVCSECGYSVEKQAGDPCKAKKCPKCGTALTGSNKKKTKKAVKSTKTLRKAVKKIKDLRKAKTEIEKASNEKEERNKTLVSAVKKTASQVISLRKEIAKITKEAEDKVKLYMDNAQTILSRRAELGSEYSKNLSDSEILNEDKFERAKLEKENELLKASKDKESEIIVGEKPEIASDEISRLAKEIDDKFTGKKKRNS